MESRFEMNDMFNVLCKELNLIRSSFVVASKNQVTIHLLLFAR